MSKQKYRHIRDTFHSEFVKGAKFKGALDMPVMQGVYVKPGKLISFSEAMQQTCNEFNCFVHFYEDDYKIERFWNTPMKYIQKLKKFAGVISPDFSTCYDFPVPLKIWNAYRNQACGFYLQKNGLTVVPNVRCESNFIDSVLAGVPHNATIAISGHGCIKNPIDRKLFKISMKRVVDLLHPSLILYYGSDAYGILNYPEKKQIPIVVYPCRTHYEMG